MVFWSPLFREIERIGFPHIKDRLLLMGRRDSRTCKGKIFKGTFGKARPKEGNAKGWWDSVLERRTVPVPHPPQHKSRLTEEQQSRQIEQENAGLLPAQWVGP